MEIVDYYIKYYILDSDLNELAASPLYDTLVNYCVKENPSYDEATFDASLMLYFPAISPWTDVQPQFFDCLI